MSQSRCHLLLTTIFLLLAVINASSSAGGTFPKPAFVSTTQSEHELVSKSKKETNSTQELLASIPDWKRKLPYPLNNKTSTLQRITIPGFGGRCMVEVYLLGTAHVSNDSSRDVKLLLENVDPDVIFLEICDQRIPMLTAPPPQPKWEGGTSETLEDPKTKSWWRRIGRKKKGKTVDEQGGEQKKSLHGMAANMLTTMQQDYADSLGVELGGEFRTAYNYWKQSRVSRPPTGIHMILGDRPLYLTLTRAWESLGIWGKTKLLAALFISTLQKPDPEELREWMKSILEDDSGDILTKSIEELKKHFPTLEEVIIRERDAYMACKLYQTCRQMLIMQQQQSSSSSSSSSSSTPSSPSIQRVVAIVGAGHVKGMCKWLTGGNQGQGTPEEVLAGLIKIKKEIAKEDARILTHDVMVVNHDQLQEIAQRR